MSLDVSDPRARELLLADPERIRRLAGFLGQAAEQSGHASVGLRGAAQDVVWHGPAADTFRHAIAPMTRRLDGLHAGFRDAATALAAYATQLAHLQARDRPLATTLAALRAQLPIARNDAEIARQAVRLALRTPGTPGSALTSAAREAERAQHRLSELEDALLRLRGRRHALLNEFEDERSACRARIAHARRLAPEAALRGRLHDPIFAAWGPSA
ncbi:MAG TPA: hypothetical protein VFN55_16790 [Solirubrobacteraceae bacterium]|nr:hypothetical protein [Solirubrobacteraceae bacterium]